MYETLIGCCETPADELIIEALYATPTLELAEAAAAMANAKGYKTTGQEVLEDVYQ